MCEFHIGARDIDLRLEKIIGGLGYTISGGGLTVAWRNSVCGLGTAVLGTR
jgi:hypothetical protein